MDKIANPAPGFQRNPDKIITVEPYVGTVTVRAGDTVIASSANAKVLTEAPYPAAFYIPFADIDFDRLSGTEHSTHCPYKGDASYFSIQVDGKTLENAVWSYEKPFPAMTAIGEYLAFYPNKVDRIEELPA